MDNARFIILNPHDKGAADGASGHLHNLKLSSGGGIQKLTNVFEKIRVLSEKHFSLLRRSFEIDHHARVSGVRLQDFLLLGFGETITVNHDHGYTPD